MRRRVMTMVTFATATMASTACAGTSPPAPDAAASQGTTAPSTVPAADLAPSQQTAETAPRPETPPPCDPSDLVVWTAQAQVHDAGADAVLRLRNDGAVWCEVDVSGSPAVDPLMEPDVWLDPGAWADLIVGPADDGCEGATTVTRTDLDVNGEDVVVATALVVPCEAQLVAFYPTEVSDEPCEELAVAAVDGAVVVRNDGVRPCRLGSLVSATGDAVTVETGEPALATPVLAGGDVVAFEVRAGGGTTRSVALAFDSGVTLDVALAGTPAQIVGGAPQPWIGGPGWPSTAEPDALLAALDPFR